MISSRAENISPFIVMEVLEAAQELEHAGEDVVHLEIGEPDFDTPEIIRRAGEKALLAGQTHYTHSLGKRELREALAEHFDNRYGATAMPERILVTLGTSPALWITMAVLIEPGDEVILGDPSYACYPNFIRFFGGIPKFVPLSAADGYQFPIEEVRKAIGPRTKAILVNSPSNPTGTLLCDDNLTRLAELGVPVISDEIYHGLVYSGRERTMLEFDPDAIVLNGFSKAFAMTGWRLGYLVLPEELLRPAQKIQQNFFISAADFVQTAAITALREAGPDVERMCREYDKRRRRIVSGLRELGFRIETEPTGAFYVLADARHLDHDSKRLAFDILARARVGVCPGIDFGSNAEGYIRFCYAASIERIDEALRRLRVYLDER